MKITKQTRRHILVSNLYTEVNVEHTLPQVRNQGWASIPHPLPLQHYCTDEPLPNCTLAYGDNILEKLVWDNFCGAKDRGESDTRVTHLLATGYVRSKLKMEKKTRVCARTHIKRGWSLKFAQQHGDRGEIETCCDQTSPKR